MIASNPFLPNGASGIRQVFMDRTFHQEVESALKSLATDRNGLARQLGLAVGSLRAWENRGAPPYARLALAALVAELDPAEILASDR